MLLYVIYIIAYISSIKRRVRQFFSVLLSVLLLDIVFSFNQLFVSFLRYSAISFIVSNLNDNLNGCNTFSIDKD